MKKLFVVFAILIASVSAEAQVKINVNIGVQPAWGPTGYDYAGYYYFPELNVYYDVTSEQYVYFNNRQWIHAYRLPAYFGKPDLFRMYKVVINERNPYLNNRIHVSQYSKFKKQYNQQVIRDSREEKYFQSKFHPRHDQWEREQVAKNYNKKGKDVKVVVKNDVKVVVREDNHYKNDKGRGNDGRNDYSKNDNSNNRNNSKKEEKGRGSYGPRS
jgi:hypothetical protein